MGSSITLTNPRFCHTHILDRQPIICVCDVNISLLILQYCGIRKLQCCTTLQWHDGVVLSLECAQVWPRAPAIIAESHNKRRAWAHFRFVEHDGCCARRKLKRLDPGVVVGERRRLRGCPCAPLVRAGARIDMAGLPIAKEAQKGVVVSWGETDHRWLHKRIAVGNIDASPRFLLRIGDEQERI